MIKNKSGWVGNTSSVTITKKQEGYEGWRMETVSSVQARSSSHNPLCLSMASPTLAADANAALSNSRKYGRRDSKPYGKKISTRRRQILMKEE